MPGLMAVSQDCEGSFIPVIILILYPLHKGYTFQIGEGAWDKQL